MHSTLHSIDWRKPWLATVAPAAAAVLRHDLPWREALTRCAQDIGLCNHRGLPLQFVPQEALPTGRAYEAHIGETGCVPTRDNLHDAFNALVWLTFPKIKVVLNRLQAEEIFRAHPQGEVAATRGKLRDGATIFDENAGLLVSAKPSMLDDLAEHRWESAFLAHRADWQTDTALYLFGHALMEKLETPYKAITAHTWAVTVEEDFFRADFARQLAILDDLIAAQLQRGVTTAHFSPLPVAGIPGWWAGQDQDFYADRQVFREKRVR